MESVNSVDDINKMKNTLASLIEKNTDKDSATETLFPGLFLGHSSKSVPRFPLIYKPSICVIAQGKKEIFTEKKSIIYDPFHYLVVALPIPLEAQITASSNESFLGLSLEVDMSAVGKLLISMKDQSHKLNKDPALEQDAIYSSPLSKEVLNAFIRLLELLDDPSDLKILGEGIINEIVYYVLKGEQGSYLRSLALQDTKSLRIAKVIRYLNDNIHKSLNIDSIADFAGMGNSTLHHAFEKAVGQSPIQYLKKIRLHQAKLMITSRGMNVSEAAYNVGYNNISQFSREFKRQFGHTPSQSTSLY